MWRLRSCVLVAGLFFRNPGSRRGGVSVVSCLCAVKHWPSTYFIPLIVACILICVSGFKGLKVSIRHYLDCISKFLALYSSRSIWNCVLHSLFCWLVARGRPGASPKMQFVNVVFILSVTDVLEGCLFQLGTFCVCCWRTDWIGLARDTLEGKILCIRILHLNVWSWLSVLWVYQAECGRINCGPLVCNFVSIM